MYLSLLMLNPHSRAVRADLADCQALHRTIMSAFPNVEATRGARSSLGVLYRADTNQRTGLVSLLVQSSTTPDWSCLEAGYLLTTHGEPDNPRTREVGSAYAGLRDGQVLTFRLRANPTRKIDTKSGPDGRRRNGKRVELRDEAGQLAWLRRKADQSGFDLLTVRHGDVADVRLTLNDGAVGRRANPTSGAPGRLTFGSLLCEGRLRITDADRFRGALERGIGSGKAYGFGLLSIASVRG